MHQTNKKRISNLMALLNGKGKMYDIEDMDINLGESMSNADVVSQASRVSRSKLPSISQRMLDSVTDGLGASTAIGTNVKGSSKQYGELP